MEKLIYILKTEENIRVPLKGRETVSQKIAWVVLGMIVIGTFIFQESFWEELTLGMKLASIGLLLGTLFGKNSEFVSFPIELHFYESCLKIYRPKVYYSKNIQRKELYIFKYDEIKQCVYHQKSNKISIYGVAFMECFDYKKDGSLLSSPTICKTGEDMCCFYTSATAEVNFVSEIEKHSPINVIIED